jgi:SAM-dependent methyltransferase
MPSWVVWALVCGPLGLAALAYWHLVVTEGAYLGQGVVTWLYDRYAPRYDAIKHYDPDAEAYYLGRPLADALRGYPAPVVLDIATGTARLPLTLLGQPTFAGRIIGLDHSRRMLDIAASKTAGYGGRAAYIWRDAASLPFPDAVFDAVSCLEMLEFTPDPVRQMREAVRVLRPGGILLTTRRRGLSAWLMPGRTHSRREFSAILRSLGLSHVEILTWQVEYDLVWAVRAGSSARRAPHLTEILLCPRCGSTGWLESADTLECDTCSSVYPVLPGHVVLLGG